jgi:hypothetical protein
VLQAVREFNDSDKDNDSLHEHDCFLFKLEENLYAVKIDYYHRKLAFGSDDPSDPEEITRL